MTSSKIFSLQSFFSRQECSELVSMIEAIGFESQFSGDVRLIRSRAQFEDPELAKLIWVRLYPSLPKLSDIYDLGFPPEPSITNGLETYFPVHLNERFRCYKYGPDEEFRRHQDFSHKYSDAKRTFLTLLIYLNDGYQGGETSFDDICVTPNLGMLTFFPHELEHQGCKVISGIKYTLRTDIVYESQTD